MLRTRFVMFDWLAADLAREHSRDLLREAEHDRLLRSYQREAQQRRPGQPASLPGLVARLGQLLIQLGASLGRFEPRGQRGPAPGDALASGSQVMARDRLDLPLGAITLRQAPFVGERRSIVEALRLLNQTGAPGLLTTYQGRPAVVTRADIELALPSPVTSLGRYEIPALLERVKVQQVVRGPSPVVGSEESLRTAVALLRECWRPLVVVNGDRPSGILTAKKVLMVLVESES